MKYIRIKGDFIRVRCLSNFLNRSLVNVSVWITDFMFTNRFTSLGWESSCKKQKTHSKLATDLRLLYLRNGRRHYHASDYSGTLRHSRYLKKRITTEYETKMKQTWGKLHKTASFLSAFHPISFIKPGVAPMVFSFWSALIVGVESLVPFAIVVNFFAFTLL